MSAQRKSPDLERPRLYAKYLTAICSNIWTMTAKLLSASGYQGDAMNLPVTDVDSAELFYVEKMGFTVVERSDDPIKRAVLERDGVKMALAENGGDSEQDGCAFPTDDVVALRDEFVGNGLAGIGTINDETGDDGSKYKVFFVVAPDGLCYWFGESITGDGGTQA